MDGGKGAAAQVAPKTDRMTRFRGGGGDPCTAVEFTVRHEPDRNLSRSLITPAQEARMQNRRLFVHAGVVLVLGLAVLASGDEPEPAAETVRVESVRLSGAPGLPGSSAGLCPNCGVCYSAACPLKITMDERCLHHCWPDPACSECEEGDPPEPWECPEWAETWWFCGDSPS